MMFEDIIHVLALPYILFHSIFKVIAPEPLASELAACFYAMSALTISYVAARLFRRDVVDKVIASAIAVLWLWVAGIAVILVWLQVIK